VARLKGEADRKAWMTRDLDISESTINRICERLSTEPNCYLRQDIGTGWWVRDVSGDTSTRPVFIPDEDDSDVDEFGDPYEEEPETATSESSPRVNLEDLANLDDDAEWSEDEKETFLKEARDTFEEKKDTFLKEVEEKDKEVDALLKEVEDLLTKGEARG
jgi:hypothetical protein